MPAAGRFVGRARGAAGFLAVAVLENARARLLPVLVVENAPMISEY